MKLHLKRYRLLSAVVVIVVMLIGLGGVDLSAEHFLPWLGSPAVQAQPAPLRRVNPAAISAQIYAQLPDTPLENQYISSETGTVAEDNTLVSRLIRYHIYIRQRPTNFRLDWKLTLADYLGAFERMSASDYPNYGLWTNPIAEDIAAVRSLSREQRDRLVNTLYETFTTPSANPGES